MTGPVVGAVVARLRAAGCVFAEEEAALLIEAASGVGGSAAVLEDMVARREAGEPLEVIVGWVEFYGIRHAVDAGVFVPRRRSELLVREAVALLRAGDSVVELCAGVAAIAASLAVAVPGVEAYAAEIDERAVAVARRNLAPERVFQGDLFSVLPGRLQGRVAVLVANAPYVPSAEIELMPREAREHEPLHTLDGGADGLDVQRRVVADAAEWLRPGGSLLIETSEEQASATAALFTAAGFVPRVVHDDELFGTVVVGAR